jgi:hypothetical protein
VHAFVVFLAAAALAHSPMETSTRVIARESTLDITLTVGMEAGAILLEGQPREASLNRPVGRGFALPKDFAARLFEISADNAPLAPNKTEVRSDGLECNFLLEYPQPPTNALAVKANYVSYLPAALRSSFIVTDENGNIFFTREVKQGDSAFAFTLPPAMPASATPPPAAAPSNDVVQQHLSSPASAPTKPSGLQGSSAPHPGGRQVWRRGPILAVILIFFAGIAWVWLRRR